jgi:hypothetical protein
VAVRKCLDKLAGDVVAVGLERIGAARAAVGAGFSSASDGGKRWVLCFTSSGPSDLCRVTGTSVLNTPRPTQNGVFTHLFGQFGACLS